MRIKLFDFKGTPIQLNLWFLIIFLITSITTGIAVLVSVLVHEMAHALIAKQKGYRVHNIEIDLVYGSASIDANMTDKDSIPIIAAGPLSNLLLFTISTLILQNNIASLPIIKTFFESMLKVNLVLFIFNILPIFPMDGGQITKSLLRINMKNKLKANKINNIISLVTSSLLFFYAMFIFNIMLIIFSIYFMYLAIRDLNLK